jgi:hypothetical protein
MNAEAPAGGIAVEVWTTGAAAYVPLIMTVPAGSTTGTFILTTAVVSSNVQDTVTAFYNGATKTANLTVTP